MGYLAVYLDGNVMRTKVTTGSNDWDHVSWGFSTTDEFLYLSNTPSNLRFPGGPTIGVTEQGMIYDFDGERFSIGDGVHYTPVSFLRRSI